MVRHGSVAAWGFGASALGACHLIYPFAPAASSTRSNDGTDVQLSDLANPLPGNCTCDEASVNACAVSCDGCSLSCTANGLCSCVGCDVGGDVAMLPGPTDRCDGVSLCSYQGLINGCSPF